MPAGRWEADDAALLLPSVRNPSERAGVSRFSAAALAPPLNKIDLKKNGAEKKKKKAKPRGESPHPPCRGRPPTPPGPLALQPGPAHQAPARMGGGGGTRFTPRAEWAGGGCVPLAPLAPSFFSRIWPLGRRPAPTHPPTRALAGGGWSGPGSTTSLWVKRTVIFHSCGGWGEFAHPTPVNC